MTSLLLALTILCNILAQFILKHAISGVALDNFSLQSVLKIISVPLLWVGAISYGFSFLFYIFSLSKGELGRVAPVTQALSILGVFVISIIIFNEALTLYKSLGLILIIAGVYFLVR